VHGPSPESGLSLFSSVNLQRSHIALTGCEFILVDCKHTVLTSHIFPGVNLNYIGWFTDAKAGRFCGRCHVFIQRGQLARSNHSVIFRRSLQRCGTGWTSNKYSVWSSSSECGTMGEVCHLRSPCFDRRSWWIAIHKQLRLHDDTRLDGIADCGSDYARSPPRSSAAAAAAAEASSAAAGGVRRHHSINGQPNDIAQQLLLVRPRCGTDTSCRDTVAVFATSYTAVD